jgi:UDP-N-acetylmuramoylalanine--D-glutamate ligase
MKIGIIGAARSGFAAAILAKKLGHDVFLTESRNISEFPEILSEFNRFSIKYEFGTHSNTLINESDLIIASPGIPDTAPVIQKAQSKKIPIISELEFAWQNTKNPVIAITGTNGKTTTTSLIAFILNNSGKKALTAGNIGTPLSKVITDASEDTIIVTEVSSYQLHRIDKFNPEIALILNITPDHLSYHGNFDNYAKAKYKISKNHTENNLLIINADDEIASSATKFTKGKTAYFSMKKKVRGIYNLDGKMCLNYPDKHKEVIMHLEDISIPGIHNAYNSMAAALAARAFEVTNENIRDCLMKFEGVEHRLEFVREINGVKFINDSKATNINATWYALSSFKNPIIWIAGGRGDSNNYSNLDDVVLKNVKFIISIGEESRNIFNHFSGMKRCIKADSLEDAVKKALEESACEDIVLFTPACKSFDMFMNYEHRGEVFKDIVKGI